MITVVIHKIQNQAVYDDEDKEYLKLSSELLTYIINGNEQYKQQALSKI